MAGKKNLAKDTLLDSSGLAGMAARAKVKRKKTMADRMREAGLDPATGGLVRPKGKLLKKD